MPRESSHHLTRSPLTRRRTSSAGRTVGVLRRISRMQAIFRPCGWPRCNRRVRAGSRATPGLLLTAALPLLIVISLGCGSSKKATTKSATSTSPGISAPAATTQAVTTITASPAPTITKTSAPTANVSASAPSGGGLSGKWSGEYSGAYQGTFTLNWQQSGSTLLGSITLSTPPATLGINGTVEGGAIRFGTVGSVAITYSGTVSGNSISGSYQTPTGNGSWSATRSP